MYHVGYKITGEAFLSLWGGGEGWVMMQPTYLLKGRLSKGNLLRCVNDDGLGCEAILSVDIHIWDVYHPEPECNILEYGYFEFNRDLQFDSKPWYHQYYNKGI